MKLDYFIEQRKKIWEELHDLEADKKFVKAASKEIMCNKELMSVLLKSPEKLIPLTFLIVNKDKKTVPFFPNTVQMHVLNRITKAKEDYRLGKRNSLKFRCLKGRQQGVTAIITAYQLALTLLNQNFSGFTMADTGDNARVILNDKAKYPYKHLPDVLKPHEKFNSATEIYFDVLNSSWRIASAESGEAGRSRTISFFHGSETAFWSNYEAITAALNPALVGDAVIFEETTANGHNHFYESWFDKDSDFENIFLVWWLSDEYKLNFESDEIRENFINSINSELDSFFKKLKLLRDKEGLDYNQLYWYATKRKTLKGLLEQEYPCSEEEAFLYSGRPYFDREAIERNIIEVRSIEPIETKMDGSVVIFEYPEVDEKYYVGADVAEGIAEGDSSHAKIIKASTAEEVAYIHGHFSTDRFGEILVEYGKKYNNAYIGIENNNHGHAVINTVYIYLGYRAVHFEYEQNRAADKKKRGKRLGWITTEASKYIMLDELDTAIRNNEILFNDVNLYKECHTVLVDDEGKVSINGKDRVAASAIAWQMRKYYNKNSNVAQYYEKLAEDRRKRIEESGLKIVGEN